MSKRSEQNHSTNPEPTPDPERAARSFAWMARFGGALFGTIIAPVIVAVILKLMDQPAAQNNPAQNNPGPNSPAPTSFVASNPAPEKPQSELPTPESSAERNSAQVAGATPAQPTTSIENQPNSTPSEPPSNNDTPVDSAKLQPNEPKVATAPARGRKKNQPTTTDDSTNTDYAGDWKPLFNGRDFTGWVVPKNKHWSVDPKSKTIVADGGRGEEKLISFLLTEEEFADFRLRFEFRMESNADSGIALRTLVRENFLERLQIQLREGDPKSQKVPMGTIIGLPTDEHNENTLPKIPVSSRPAQSWNVAEIEFRGPRLKVTINGKLAQDVRTGKKAHLANARPDLLRTSGRIGLQCQAGRVEFRRIEVDRITGEK